MQGLAVEAHLSEDSMKYTEELAKLNEKMDRLSSEHERLAHPSIWKSPSIYIALATLALTIIGLPIMLVSWLHPVLVSELKKDVTIETTNQLKDPQKQIDGIVTDIAVIKGQLQTLEPLIREALAKKLHAAKNLPAGQIEEIAKLARAKSVKADPADVVSAGRKVLRESETNLGAWHAALALLDYRSFLNVDFSPPTYDPTRPAPEAYVARTHVIAPTTETAAEVGASQRITLAGTPGRPEEGARWEELSRPRPDPSSGRLIIFEMDRKDNKLELDGMYLKNVVIKDVTVAYNGGSVKLENVYFVNCKFDFPSPSDARELATRILSSPAITFDKAA